MVNNISFIFIVRVREKKEMKNQASFQPTIIIVHALYKIVSVVHVTVSV